MKPCADFITSLSYVSAQKSLKILKDNESLMKTLIAPF